MFNSGAGRLAVGEVKQVMAPRSVPTDLEKEKENLLKNGVETLVLFKAGPHIKCRTW